MTEPIPVSAWQASQNDITAMLDVLGKTAHSARLAFGRRNSSELFTAHLDEIENLLDDIRTQHAKQAEQ